MAAVVLIEAGAFGSVDHVGWAFNSVEDAPRLLIIFSTKVLTGMSAYILTHLLLWVLVGRPDGFESFFLKIFGQIYQRYKRSSPTSRIKYNRGCCSTADQNWMHQLNNKKIYLDSSGMR